MPVEVFAVAGGSECRPSAGGLPIHGLLSDTGGWTGFSWESDILKLVVWTPWTDSDNQRVSWHDWGKALRCATPPNIDSRPCVVSNERDPRPAGCLFRTHFGMITTLRKRIPPEDCALMVSTPYRVCETTKQRSSADGLVRPRFAARTTGSSVQTRRSLEISGGH